jgi:hypothetical protein
MDEKADNSRMAKAPKPKAKKPAPANTRAKSRAKADVLTDAQKDEITMRLAMFDTPTEIAEDMLGPNNEPLLSRQAITKYDPTTAGSYQKRRILFEETRAAFLKEVSSEPIANKAYRIRRLALLHSKALKARDLKEARMALEQAAKEMGDVYTKANTAALAVAVPVDSASLDGFDLDEKRNMLADRLGQVIGRGLGNQATKH